MSRECQPCRERKNISVPSVHIVAGTPMCSECFSFDADDGTGNLDQTSSIRRIHRKRTDIENRTCKGCGAEFAPDRANKFYCSETCRNRKHWRECKRRKTARIYAGKLALVDRVDLKAALADIASGLIEEDIAAKQGFPVTMIRYRLHREKIDRNAKTYAQLVATAIREGFIA